MNKKTILLRFVLIVYFIVLFIFNAFYISASENKDYRSAVLMEANTGKILMEKNADEALPPASVTKIMTMLLAMEAIDSGNINLSDTVQISEYAASMGGSQVFLAPGEIMTVEDLLKSVTVSSANDASVALAEFISGSEEAFVEKMNERAAELNMINTHFENTNGLDDTTTSHLTSARDIALMSAELLRHPKILEYSSIWQDSIRNGEFVLTNTNRLIRFYNGANGLKTGSTSKALFCMSATAKRDNLQLISVIMGAPTRDARNEAAKSLLDWGFANYSYFIKEGCTAGNIAVLGGCEDFCPVKYDSFETVLNKGEASKITYNIILPETVSAPIKEGDVVGIIEYKLGDKIIGENNIYAEKSIEKIGFFDLFSKLLTKFLMV